MNVGSCLIERLPSGVQPRPRVVRRMPARAAALIQSAQGERAAARLRDISIYGCNLEGDTNWLRLGMFVSIRLSDSWTIQAIVRWVREANCGVEFLRPIPDADAESINQSAHHA